MNAMTHYIEASIKGTAKEEISFAVTQLISSIHRAIAEGNSLAVSFPGFVETGPQMSTGNQLRVFGTISALESLMGRHDFTCYRGTLYNFGKEVIREVPETHEFEIYHRNRSNEKKTPGFLERQARRYAKRHPNGPAFVMPAVSPYSGRMPHFHFFSSSTGDRKFTVFFERRSVSAGEAGHLTALGFGVPVPKF